MKAPFTSVLQGYVTIRIWGYGAERFFRLCASRGIVLWNLKQYEGDMYRCCICMRDFFSLRDICRKTKTRVFIEKRSGFPTLYRRYRSRLIFFVAFLGMLFGVYRCTNYIWNIEITGNSYLSDETILRFLKEQGIAPGSARAEIDTDALELLLRQSYAQIIWSSVHVDGTSLVIGIREQLRTDTDDAVTAVDADLQAVDLVASKNAVIASIVTRKGTPCVTAGDTVLAGDTLVSARCDIYDDNGEVMYSLYQQADADVYGYVEYSFSETLPIQSLIEVDTDEVSRAYFIRFFNRYLCLPYQSSPYEEYISLEKTQQLCLIGNFYLPVYWGTREYVKRESGYYILAEENAKQTAAEDFLYFVGELEENGVLIIDKNVMIEEVGNSYEVTGQVSALESIAVERLTEIPPVVEEQLIDESE